MRGLASYALVALDARSKGTVVRALPRELRALPTRGTAAGASVTAKARRAEFCHPARLVLCQLPLLNPPTIQPRAILAAGALKSSLWATAGGKRVQNDAFFLSFSQAAASLPPDCLQARLGAACWRQVQAARDFYSDSLACVACRRFRTRIAACQVVIESRPLNS